MPETKFGELESLVGRTFERRGYQRTVERMVRFSITGRRLKRPRVEWVNWEDCRCPGLYVRHTASARRMARWLSGAEEVKT
ncbi:MAG: hypothetical protein M0R22_00935 [Dehalococcoidia bacterium]|jgi:hypothetical protein|nr:hypothetical protein [Dehalococcoidia bacterium]